MKRTYTGTFCYPNNIEEATVQLYFTDGVKRSRIYGLSEDEEKPLEFKGMKSWSIIEGGKEAEACERWLGEKDENDEYLVIEFVDGGFDVYLNSHTVMFIV